MLTDAQVKEIAYLREYASILSDFKYYILGGCVALGKKAESILNDVSIISRDTEYKSTNCYKEADRVIRDFNSIVDRYHLSSHSKLLLGDSAIEAQTKIKQVEQCSNNIQSKVAQIKSHIEALSARTGAYSLLIGRMAENGSEEIKKRCNILEQYKGAK